MVLSKELHFIGPALGDAHSKELYTLGILPRIAEALLCNLQRFPSLERLMIRFDYDSQGLTEWATDFHLLHVEGEQVIQAEASAAWCALMRKTYLALAKIKSPHFKHLEVRQLIWKKDANMGLLGHFDEFTISTHGEDDGVGWRSNKTEDYPALMEKLDEYFISHLDKISTLSTKALEERPLGLEGTSHTSRFLFGFDSKYEGSALLVRLVLSRTNRITRWP